MLIGDPRVFAIESEITCAYERLHFRALGFFVIHILNRRYGVHEPEATMLACSLGEVQKRLDNRGSHFAAFATEPDAGAIADNFRKAIYMEHPSECDARTQVENFAKTVQLGRVTWAPDGDEAFDDGSYILQFDVGNRVRLIAFRCTAEGLHDPGTLSDMWINADDFYGVLQRWHDAFLDEWSGTTKVSERIM